VPRVGLAAGPHFMEQEGAGAIGGSVQVIGQAAVFFACGANQSAQFGFEEHVLAVAWPQLHDERYSVFWKLRVLGLPRLAGMRSSLLCFPLRHSARDSTSRT